MILEEDEREKLRGGGEEEIRLLRQTLEKVQIKLLETRKENQSLQTQLKPERSREREDNESERGRERELMESLAELQAKLTDTQERYHQAVEEVENLRVQVGTRERESQRLTSSTLEHEVTQLKAQLAQSESEVDKATQHIKRLEEALKKTEDDRESAKEKEQRAAQLEELYKEAQEEVRVLQVNAGFFYMNKIDLSNLCSLFHLCLRLTIQDLADIRGAEVFFFFSLDCFLKCSSPHIIHLYGLQFIPFLLLRRL